MDVAALAVDSKNASIVYAGSYSGFQKSIDGGQTWTSTSILASALAVDPTNTSTIYASTNEMGVFKSIDAGRIWFAINSGLPSSGSRIYAFAVDPVNPATVYLGSGSYGASSTAKLGVYKSTNGGQSWVWSSSGLSLLNEEMTITSLAVDSTNPSTVYAGVVGRGISEVPTEAKVGCCS